MHIHVYTYTNIYHEHIYTYRNMSVFHPMFNRKSGDSESFRRGGDSPQEGAGQGAQQRRRQLVFGW